MDSKGGAWLICSSIGLQNKKDNMYAYNAMALILSGAPQNASLKVLVGEVLNSRCLMSPGALGFFIRCLGNAGLVEEASFVFDRVRETGLCVLNAYTYNCLLEAFSKSNSSSVDLVESKLEEMRNCGFHFVKFTLTPVLQVYCNTGKSERALSVFDEILSRGWLDDHISTVLVVSFCKRGQVDKAFDLIEMLEARGIRLNYKAYCVLIHGFVKESQIDKALQLFEKMRRMGMNAGIALYDVLIGGLCKHKDLERESLVFLREIEVFVVSLELLESLWLINHCGGVVLRGEGEGFISRGLRVCSWCSSFQFNPKRDECVDHSLSGCFLWEFRS